MTSLVKDKTNIELLQKKQDLLNYIKMIDNELKLRETLKPPSIVKQLYYGNTTSTIKNSTIVPRSTIIRGTITNMKEVLKENNINFSSKDKKSDLISKIRANGLIHKVEVKRITEQAKKNKYVRATVKEMKEILTNNKISYSSTIKKDELCILIRENKLVRQTEALHLKNNSIK